MAKSLFTRIKLCSVHQTRPRILGNKHYRKFSTNDVPVKEIQIPLEYGNLSGKLWGTGSERPILALHGWQDNAGTWDPLIPMLYKEMNNNRPILTVDLPGHGLSSWIPRGTHYYAWEYPQIIYYLKEYFKWDKVSIIAHSMGSIAGCRYSCICPDDTDFYIAVDHLIHDDFNLDAVLERYPLLFKKNHVAMQRLDEEPPAYTWDEMVKIWHLGTNKSVDLESVPYLLKRGSKVSSKDSSKFYFSRDPRLKYTLFNPESKMFVEALALRLKCPTLYIKATDSPYASDGFSVGMRELIEQNHPKFEAHYVPGTHHVHLNNPGVILPPIISFLRKYNFLK